MVITSPGQIIRGVILIHPQTVPSMNEHPSPSHSPEEVARAFLAALDAGRWSEAAALVDPETAERFRAQQIELLRLEERMPGTPPSTETVFTRATALLGVQCADEAEALPATELLARFAESLHPVSVLRRAHEAGGHSGTETAPPRLTRTIVGCTKSDDGNARVEYRTDWRQGETGSDFTGEVHVLTALHTPTGWRVRDADLGGHGNGHILMPDEMFASFRGDDGTAA
jgi:hypothetical protein